MKTKNLLFPKRSLLCSIIAILSIFILTSTSATAASRYSVGGAPGTWHSTTMWSATSGGAPGASIPVAGDDVYIENGRTVWLDQNEACANLTIGTGVGLGILEFRVSGTNVTFTVSGNVSIIAGSTFDVSNQVGLNFHTLNIGGNLTNAGTFNMCTAIDDHATVIFNGSSQQTISGAGTTTFYSLTSSNNSANGLVLGRNLTLTESGTQDATNLTVTANCILDLATYTCNAQNAGDGTLTVNAGAKLRIGGTGTFPANYGTNTLNATSTVEYYGTAQIVGQYTYGNLILSGSGIKTLTGVSTINGNFTFAGTATATAATGMTIGGSINIGSGTTFTGGAFTHNVGNSWNNGGSFVSVGTTINFNGSGAQTIVSGGTGAGKTFNNLTINNSAGISLNTNDASLSGTLTLTSGNITTGSNTLIVANNTIGAITRTSGYIIGNLQRAIEGAGSLTYSYYVGTAGSYAPVSIAFTTLTGIGNLTVKVTSGQNPNGGSPINTSKDVALYWTLTNAGVTFTSYAPTFTYNSGDIIGGATQTNFIVGKYTPPWTSPTPVVNAGSGPYTTQVSGLTSFSDFVVGEYGCTNPISGGTIAADQEGCTPFNPALITSSTLPTGYSGTLEYKWQLSTTGSGSGFSDIASSNAATYDPPSITLTTWYKRLARVDCKSDWTGAAESNVVKMTVDPLPTSLILTGSTICVSPGGNGTITSSTSVIGINYQLYNAGNNPVQAAKAGTGSGLTWSALAAGNGYYAIGTDATTLCISPSSNAVNVATNPNPVALVLTGSTICASPGGNGTITSSTSVIGINYQLYDAGNNPVQAAKAGTNSGLTWSSLAAGNGYYAIGTNATTLCVSPSSNAVNVSTYSNPVPTISGPGSVCGIPSVGNHYITESGMSNYTWTVSLGGSITAGSTTNDITVTWSTAGAKTITITYTDTHGCDPLTPTSYPVNVFDLPVPTISGSAAICGIPSAGNHYLTESGMSNYAWTVSLGGSITAGSTTNDITVTWSTTGAKTVTVTYTDGNGCNPSAPTSYPVNVYPIPTVDAVSNVAYCNGATTTAINFTSSISGTTFAWVNDTPSIGLAASGTGDIPSFTATNSTTATVTATITVTPTANGCIGPPLSFNITVYPTPIAIATPSSQTICSGDAITTIVLTSNLPGGDVMTNGGFETGSFAPWVILDSSPVPVVSNASAHTGTYSAFIGSPGPGPGETPGDASIYQTITVPATGGTLSYWYLPSSADNIFWDWQDAYITNTSGTILATIMHVCSNDQVWENVTYDMAAFAGQTVRVEFLVHGDNAGDPTSMFVDDVTMLWGSITTYAWTRNNFGTVTGIPGSGSGDISGTLTNLINVPVTVTFFITPTANGCVGGTTQATVLVNPTPTVNAVSNVTYCNGATTSLITLGSPVAGATFAWVNSTPSIGLAGSGTGNIPSFTATNAGTAAVIATMTVTPSANGCVGTPLSFTITVYPTATVNAVSNVAYCNGATTSLITIAGPVAGTTFAWVNDTPSIGLAASGTGDIPSFTATNPGPTTRIATITITPTANGCVGTPLSFTITVYPTPTVSAISNVAYCNGATTAPIPLIGPVAGTTFAWVNSTPSIGLAANGTGDIPSFTATNPGTAPVVATITVTPTANGCVGTPLSFNITVNPIPTVNAVSNVAYCNGATTTLITLGSPVAGTTFAWVNSTPSIGLAGSGTGNIPSFTATNSGITTVIATITITPTANGCVGPPISFTITVYPTATVNAVSNVAYCNGATTSAIPISGPVAGTTFAWVNSTPSIGLAANGTGDIPSFSATNPGTAPVIATITITPSANGCVGTPLSFTITVNPIPTVNAVSNVAYCNGATTTLITLGSPVTGATFAWVNSTPSIGLAGSGTGNIPSFTATNAGITTVIATITVTPTANGCVGPPISFTITVYPTATVNAISNVAYCNGATTSAITISGPVAGTTFAWVNSTPSIGLAGSGTGDIPSFTATNASTATVIATITVTPTANGCVGTPRTFTITVYPSPTVNAISNVAYCNGATTSLIAVTGPVAGSTFAWVNSTPSIGLAASGTGNIPSFTATNPGTAPVVATITVTPTANGCVGTSLSFTITVNPTPMVNAVSNVTYCNGATTSLITLGGPVAGTTFAWVNSTPSIGLAASGTGNIPSFTATNAGITIVVATVTITPSANGCVGTPLTFTITVYPTPTVNAISNIAYCNGATTTAVTISGPVAGTTFAWVNSTPSIGLAGSGTGNIPSFTATNAGTTNVVATITVTPTANGCVGTPLTFTITVYPTPTVNAISNVAYCNGTTTSLITVTGPVAGTSFTWVNSTPSIGLAANGSGNIPSFTATNPGTTPVVATITVTPTANGCVGTPLSFTITVNPTPTVNAVSNVAYCNGATTTAITLSGPVAGTTFAWVNNTPSIGLAASGTGNIPSFTATNAGTTIVVATVTITPSANGCVGTPLSFNITVYPTPTVNAVSNVAYCNGTVTAAITLGGPVAGTTFAWVNNTPSIGLPASGTGNIPSFTATNSGSTTVIATVTITPSANGCVGTPLSFTITVYPTPVPIINGYSSLCVNSGYYDYTTQPGMTGYIWNVSSGGTINYGSGTNDITVSWITPGPQTVSVTYTDTHGCVPFAPTVLNVTVNPLPSAAGSITGTASVCAGASGVPYSVAPVPNALSYVWTLPPNATIASGAGTNSITVDFASNATSGNIFVFGNNLCGNGASSPPFAVTVAPLPDTAGTITGPNPVCQGDVGVVYYVAPVPNADGYVWTVPAGATITMGMNTNSIAVDFSSSATSGIITVAGTNSCGTGPFSPDFNLVVNPTPPTPVITSSGDTLTSDTPTGNQWYFNGIAIVGATSQTWVAQQTGWYWDVVTLLGCSSAASNHIYIVKVGVEPPPAVTNIVLYPNPNEGDFTLMFTAAKQEKYNIRVFNNLGVQIFEMSNLDVMGTTRQNIDLRPAPNGVYSVIISNDQTSVVKKIVINK